MVNHLKQMDIQTFITQWINAGNAFDTKQYLDFYLPDAILDDPSVGRKFLGHTGLKNITRVTLLVIIPILHKSVNW